ncbi:MAG: glycosyltransferase, partial [Phycisphaerales bacterium]|nr:glycosyltransferase [Phycisphaerales bacterium]
SLLVPIVPHQEPRLGLSLRQRASNLLERVRTTLGSVPDIIHVFGGGGAKLASETARLSRAVPAFELWRPNLETTARLTINRALGPILPEQDRSTRRTALLTVPSETISQRAAQHFPDAVVRVIRWGVHVARELDTTRTDAVCMLLIGPGRDTRAWQSAFLAALQVMSGNKRFHLFADADVTRKLRVWKHARAAGVLDRLSLIDEAEARRDVVLRADVLLYSDARGESRSILLDAMASRVTIIAAADPLADMLIDGRTARLVADTTTSQWREAIEHVVNEPTTRDRLTESAAEYVLKHHRATRQIVSLIDAYEWVAGDPVRIGPDDAPVLGQSGV